MTAALLLTVIASAVIGLLVAPAATALSQRRGVGNLRSLGLESAVANITYRLVMAVGICAALSITSHPVVRTVSDAWTTRHPQTIASVVALCLMAGLYGASLAWDRIPVIGRWSAADPTAYGAEVANLAAGEVALQLVIRIPLTVFVEETLFRGLLAPVLVGGMLTSSLLFAGYHWLQWRTIPSLMPFTIAGGILVSWTGVLWPTALIHYVANAGFLALTRRSTTS